MSTHSTNTPAENLSSTTLETYIFDEIQAMAKYAFASGLAVPEELMISLGKITKLKFDQNNPDEKSLQLEPWQEQQIKGELARIHNRLAKIVAPAKPRAIFILEQEAEKNSMWHFLGSVPLVRRLMGVSIVCIFLLAGLSLSPVVNESLQEVTILNSSGLPLFISLMFTLAAAGVGASFSLLFTASSYVKTGTFDPRYESFYWARFVLGLIAGAILAELLSHNIDLGPAISPKFVKVVSALLGGFSAQAVYDILNRLAQTIETLLEGRVDPHVDLEQSKVNTETQERFQVLMNDILSSEKSYTTQVSTAVKKKEEQVSNFPTVG